MTAPGAVRLGNRSTRMFHSAAAAVNSDSTAAPFGNRHTPSGANSGAAQLSRRGSGARARAVSSGAGGNPRGLDAHGMDPHGRRQHACRLAQKRGLAVIRLDQVKGNPGLRGEDQPRKTGPGPEIDPALGPRRNQRRELPRILAMPRLNKRFIGAGDQIDAPVPPPQQLLEACFT